MVCVHGLQYYMILLISLILFGLFYLHLTMYFMLATSPFLFHTLSPLISLSLWA